MITVEELMTRDVVTLKADAALSDVDDLLKQNHIRHVPVVDGRKLVGLVSHRDLIRALARQAAGRPSEPVMVKDVMAREVDTVQPQASALEVIDRLLDKRYGCLPVVDGQGALVGIITESDLLRLARRLLKERAAR
jgi:CBS domain-containing protein